MKGFKAFFLILAILTATSCKVSKDLLKVDNKSDFKEQIITKTIKKGDTVTFLVPRVRYKDTTITTINKVGTVLHTRFDKSGQVADIKCIEQAMNEFRIEMRQALSETKVKDKKKETKTTLSFELIALGVLALALVFLFRQTNTITKVLKTFQDQNN